MSSDNNNNSDNNEKIEVPLHPNLNGVKPNIPNAHLRQQMFDPLDNLTEDEMRECTKKALDTVNKEHDKDVALMKSDIRVPKQNYALVSFVGPTLSQKTKDKTNGMKIFGCFNTFEEAQKHAQYINNTVENKDFDIYVVEMYEFALVPPDPSKIDDVEYSDNQLNKIIKTHKVEKAKAKEVFDLRKQKLMLNPDINKLKNIEEARANPAINAQLDSFEEITNKESMDKIFVTEKLPDLKIEKVEVGEEDFVKTDYIPSALKDKQGDGDEFL